MKPAEVILADVERYGPRLHAMTDRDVSSKPSPEKWCKKEILGHLIDSASNNHQRFVRALLSDRIDFPGYTQTEWVKFQDYMSESWASIVALWISLNRHLAHIVGRIPSAKLPTVCRIGEKEKTLDILISEYITHMEHHLEQI